MGGRPPSAGEKNEDENCTSSFSSSTIPLTSGIEEAPQLLLSVISFYHIFISRRKTRFYFSVRTYPGRYLLRLE